MVSKSFTCNLHKIIDTGARTFTLMIQANDGKHKQEILNKLRSIGHKITPKTANNKIVLIKITNIDFKDGGEI